MPLNEPNRSSWEVQTVTVTTAGTAVQGPNVTVPDGFALTIVMRRHSGSPTGYIAEDESSVGTDSTRSEMKDGDTRSLHVDNAQDVWFDADTNDTVFEVIVEQ